MYRIIISILVVLFLTGCSGVKKLSIFKEEVPRQNLGLEKPTMPELEKLKWIIITSDNACLLYTSPSPRDRTRSRMPSSA